MDKEFMYKVYERSRDTLVQRVYDGDFEGLADTDFNAYWEGVGTPTRAARNRNDAYPLDTKGSALQFNGSGNYVTLPLVGMVGGGAAPQIEYSDFTMAVWWHKDNWQDGLVQALVDHLYAFSGSTVNSGFALYANYATGNLEAKVALGGGFGGTIRTASYALSNLSSGLHLIAFGSDGRYVRLWVDGVEVATYDNGSDVGVSDFGGKGTYLGADLDGINYATGICDSVGFYTSLLTTAQLSQAHVTKNPHYGTLSYHFDFDEGSGTTVNSAINTFTASISGGANWVGGYASLYRSVLVTTATGGSTEQGLQQKAGKECIITGGKQYTAHARVRADVNLITNPGFETNTSGYVAYVDGGDNLAPTLSRDTTEKHAGTASLKHVGNGTSSFSGAEYTATNLVVGDVYKVSCYTKATVGHNFNLYAGVTGNPQINATQTGDWMLVELEFTASATSAGIIFRTQNDAATFYLDSVKLTGAKLKLTVTPTGGGAAASATIVPNGEWQHIVLNYTADAAATKLALQLALTSAAANASTFYVDQVALNDGATAYDYFDQDSQGSGSTVYSFNKTTQSHTVEANTYEFLGTWNDVVSDFAYPQEINGAGSEVPVKLANGFTEKELGRSLSFDGSGDYVAIPLVQSSSITYAFWLKYTATGKNLISNMRTLVRPSTAAITWWHDVGAASNSLATPDLGDGAWHLFVLTHTGTTTTVYVDGVQTDQKTTGSINTAQYSEYIGNYAGTADFAGKIDEALTWSRAISSAEVLDLYNGKVAGTDLKLWYQFNEGKGTTAVDTSGNDNDGTITAATYATDIAPANSITKTVPRDRVDVAFNLEVRVFMISSDHPNGLPWFTGFISDYDANEDDRTIEVKLFGYGAELNEYLLTAGKTSLAFVPLYPANRNPSGGWSGAWYTQEIKPTARMTINQLKLMLAVTSGSSSFKVSIYEGDPTANFGTVLSGQATYDRGSSVLIATSTNQPTNSSTNPTVTTFEFADVVLDAGRQYYADWVIEDTNNTRVYGSNSTGLAAVPSYAPIGRVQYGRATINNASFSISQDNTFPQAYMQLIAPTGSATTVSFLSVDPSSIVREAMDNYQSQGGNLTYDNVSVPLSNTKVSYDFKAATIFDVIKKALELAPKDWYFYVDHAANKLVFKAKSPTADHTFILGKHIKSLKFEKRTRDIVNVIYLTGGELSAGVNFFKRYENKASVALYGRHLLNYSDNRVKVEGTADTIANRILDTRGAPEIRTSPGVVDYDLESIRPGDMASVRGHDGDPTELSRFDVGHFDVARFDFNATLPTTLVLQIARFGYNPAHGELTLSTTPPDVNKRIEDINRNLEKQETVNNPDTPT